ncbi:hypothetical protein [Sorangium sp. So ce131]|uniref:hypothetical protein n=1 Tax=Sorangium sp. So ce131 TaxID=3133282 RepID=UPI003F649038
MAAEQLRVLINAKAAEGWRYVRLESVEIHQDGTAGCFGIGATPSRLIRFDMAVFEKWYMSILLVLVVRIYRALIPPSLRRRCLFRQSCSRYVEEVARG